MDTSQRAAVAASRKRVIAAKTLDLEPGIVLEDRIGNPEALSEALREVTSDSAFGRQVYLGLGAQHGIVRVLEMPLIEDEGERDTAVRYHAAEAIAMPLDDAPLDHAFIGQEVTPGAGARMRVLVAAARRGRVYDLVDCARAAGLRYQGLTFSYFVLRRDGASLRDSVVRSEGAVHLRVVSELLRSKGKIEAFGCTSTGERRRLRRLDRDADKGLGVPFEEVAKGDLVRLGSTEGSPIDERGRIIPIVTIDVWRGDH